MDIPRSPGASRPLSRAKVEIVRRAELGLDAVCATVDESDHFSRSLRAPIVVKHPSGRQ